MFGGVAEDAEAHAGCETHGVFEGPRHGPLRDALVAAEG